MAEVQPFGALRFSDRAGGMDELTCPPYDIISEEQREAFLRRNEHNIIRLELPREGADPYARAGEVLRAWLEQNVLERDDAPGFYLYEEEFTHAGRRLCVKGLIGRVRLTPFSEGVVLPHEETLSGAKQDRFNLMSATNCNFSSIYSLYFDQDGAISGRVDALSAGEPDIEFNDGEGIVHRVWRVTDPDEAAALTAAFADKTLYIADGHHRYETALNYREHLREQGVVRDDAHPANFVMMTLVAVEHPGLVVLPTHRVVRGLDSFDKQALINACADSFTVTAIDPEKMESAIAARAAEGGRAFALYGGGEAHLFALRGERVPEELLPGASEAYRGLDVSILHTLVLERALGIDKANMAAQKNLTYTRDVAEGRALVDAGDADCLIVLGPTGLREIAAVAEAGEKMPQKSTYFYPKLITGHVINPLF